MAHDTQHEGTRRIWIVFFILLVVTTVEVALGIIRPDWMLMNVLGTSMLNIIFIVLTLVKAYYIVSVFMHLGDERKGLQWTVYLPILILIPYLTFILITEGSYMFSMLP